MFLRSGRLSFLTFGLAVALAFGLFSGSSWAQNGRQQAGTVGDANSEQEAEAEEQNVELRKADQEVFQEALDDFYSRDYVDAAAGFWRFIEFGDLTDNNYEWAQFFLGESLRHLGLWHGAVQFYYIVAKTRSRPEILPEALSRLKVVSQSRPFSKVLIYEDLLYDSDFGSLPGELQNWVNFVQGRYNLDNGFMDWAQNHFSQLDDDSRYFLEAAFIRAVDALRKEHYDKAREQLTTIVESEQKAPELKNEAYLAIARSYFDEGNYQQAETHYAKVVQTDLSFEQSQLLLERAWTAFLQDDFKRAMGLLHALNAPSYQQYFLPDAFILRALILKDLCHYIPAKRVLRANQFRFGRALDGLRRRVPLHKIDSVLDAATQSGAVAERTAFLRTLQAERRLIDDYDSTWEDVGLDQHLRRLYDAEMREQTRRWKMEFESSGDRVALSLLEAEEQIQLLDYEIGLDIFKRLKAGSARRAKEEALVVPYDSKYVYYEFDTEYWNDELHSYQYFITSRCFESEGDT